nr:hypothetical protein [Tanacetum cinerariifolium]
MKRASKGYTGENIPLFPVIIVKGPFVQGEGSTHPDESPTQSPIANEASSTSIDVKYRGATTTVTGLEAGHRSGNIDKTPTMLHDLPILRVNTLGSDEGSMTQQELMGRYEHDMEFDYDFDTAEKDISTAELVSIGGAAVTTYNVVVSTPSPTRNTEVSTADDITMAETLVYVRKSAAKDKAGSSKRDAEEELDQESSKRQKSGKNSKLAEEPRDKETDELSQEELLKIMIIVPEQGMNVEALQTKYLIIDWEIYIEGTTKDELVMLWSLVKEKFNSTKLTDGKERETWLLVDEDNEMSKERLR